MHPRQARGPAAPAAPAAPPGAAPPGAAPAAIAAPAPAPAGEQPASDGTKLTDSAALTRWQVPFSTKYGGVVLTLFTDRQTPDGNPAPLNGAALTAALAKLLGAAVARDWSAARAAGGELLHTAGDLLAHVHLGAHWKPAKPAPQPEAPVSGPPAGPEKAVAEPANGR